MYVRPCVRASVTVAHAVAHRTHVCTLFRRNSYTGTATGTYRRYMEGEARPVWRAKPDLLRAKPDQTTVPLASAFIYYVLLGRTVSDIRSASRTPRPSGQKSDYQKSDYQKSTPVTQEEKVLCNGRRIF